MIFILFNGQNPNVSQTDKAESSYGQQWQSTWTSDGHFGCWTAKQNVQQQSSCLNKDRSVVWDCAQQGTPIRMGKHQDDMALSAEGDLHSPVWITVVARKDVNPKLNLCKSKVTPRATLPSTLCWSTVWLVSTVLFSVGESVFWLHERKKKILKQTNSKKNPRVEVGKKGVKGSKCNGKRYVCLPRHKNNLPYLLNQNPDVGRLAGSEENNCNLCEEGICSNSL